MSQKSILEQALLQVQTLEEAVKQNAKGILASTMKQGLNDLLKEQEEEDVPNNPGEEDDVPADDTTGDDEPSINDDPSTDDESGDDDSMGDGNPFEPNGDEDDEDDEDDDDDDTLDMTGASNEEVLKVFKAMKDDDGIIVKKDGNKIEFSDGENDYIIKLDDEDNDDDNDDDDNDDLSRPLSENSGTMTGPGFKKEEPVYEISLDEDDDYDDDSLYKNDEVETEPKEDMQKGFKPKKDNVYTKKIGKQQDATEGIEDGFKPKADKIYTKKVGKQQDATEGIEYGFKPKKDGDVYTKKATKQQDALESSRTIGNGVRPPAQKTKFKAGRHEMNEELEILKKQNAQYKQALVLFKDKINEVAVFNANLTFATRLFTEHSTTKNEKLNILKRFDTLSTIEESKKLYSQIKTELETKKPVSESLMNKISSSPTSSSTEILSESKAYENPQFKRMKELMTKIK